MTVSFGEGGRREALWLVDGDRCLGWIRGSRRDATVTACGGTPTATGEAGRLLGGAARLGLAAGRHGDGLRRDA
ncbi:MAG: hypothetical protein O3A92_13475, partial [Verrucomicrobia bacterium]|nr:hypothetical protein [Verrucomicrobiota bacterium]